ncbi:hypothetical protein J5N97_006230 [Dioscorea zingiberensis]|uniref:PH domain-containing protein n=1 Tax=Dioscorea zingiberensis TaxID=325984 RepID=A0A9D5HT64_9LILI|nr:hypothetical protein J5N97_006230 [Dioscorea zingiberensis]
MGSGAAEDVADGVEFWSNPERSGWLTKQGEYIKTWRRRWFVLKQGKLFWFKDSHVMRSSVPRGVIPVGTFLTVKGAEDVLNRQFAFELSSRMETMYFIADSEKEKEEWINSIGRSIVQHSRSLTHDEVLDYDSKHATEVGLDQEEVIEPISEQEEAGPSAKWESRRIRKRPTWMDEYVVGGMRNGGRRASE